MKVKSFEELVEQIRQDERDGTYPTTKKLSGILFSGLKEQRRRHDLTQSLLADLVGVSKASIDNYESRRGGPKGIEKAEKIASHLGVKLEDIVSPEDLEAYHSPSNYNNTHKKNPPPKATKFTRNTGSSFTITQNPPTLASNVRIPQTEDKAIFDPEPNGNTNGDPWEQVKEQEKRIRQLEEQMARIKGSWIRRLFG